MYVPWLIATLVFVGVNECMYAYLKLHGEKKSMCMYGWHNNVARMCTLNPETKNKDSGSVWIKMCLYSCNNQMHISVNYAMLQMGSSYSCLNG